MTTNQKNEPRPIDQSLLKPESRCADLISLICEQIQSLSALGVSDAIQLPSRPTVSRWTVKEHVEHLIFTGKTGLILALSALEQMGENSEPLGDLGKQLFQKGSIPYKENEAPNFSLPRGMSLKKLQSSLRRLAFQIDDFKERAEELDNARGRTSHPILGGFTPRNWLQFIAMHQNHHLEIIRLVQEAE